MFGMAGTWGSDTKLDTKLVWNPYESTARSVQALELKLGSLVLLLLVTLLCAFIPLWLFRRPGSALNSGSFGPQRKTLSLVSCFAGGIFLGTCLLDLLPTYLTSINEALDDLRVTLRFPLQEFILAMGFFVVLVLEQIVLAYKDPSGSLEETEALLSSASHQHSSLQQDQSWPDGSQRPLARDRLASEHPCPRGLQRPLGHPLGGAFPGPLAPLHLRRAGCGAAGRWHPGLGDLLGPSHSQRSHRLQPEPQALAREAASPSRGHLPGYFLRHVPVRHRAGRGSDRGPHGGSVPPLPQRPGRLGYGNLHLHHVFGDPAPRTRLFRATHPQGHRSVARIRPGHQRFVREDLSGVAGAGRGRKTRPPPGHALREMPSALLPIPPYGVCQMFFLRSVAKKLFLLSPS
uniref:Solute carrier family 39 member 1 n=1 Tax=Naja naja TaxID=35670 RepID=A0A8C6X3A3_NAJNA